MSRLNEVQTFLLEKGLIIEIRFNYRQKLDNKKRYNLSFCYEVKEIVAKVQNMEIQAIDLAKFFKDSILLDVILKNQISVIVYDSMLLRVQDGDEIKSFFYPFTPQLRGYSETSGEFLQGFYYCRFGLNSVKRLTSRLLGFCMARNALSSDIFMNQLVNENGKTIDFSLCFGSL